MNLYAISLALLLANGNDPAAGADVPAKPAWHEDWTRASRLAREQKKPIFAILVCRH